MKVVVLSLLLAVALLLSCLGIFSAHLPANAQVNTSSETDGSTSMTLDDSGVGSSTPSSTGPRLIAEDIARIAYN